MLLTTIRKGPRVVLRLLSVVILTFLVFGVAAASFLGLALALQGWAATLPALPHASAQR